MTLRKCERRGLESSSRLAGVLLLERASSFI